MTCQVLQVVAFLPTPFPLADELPSCLLSFASTGSAVGVEVVIRPEL
jgi:hypothetical protein